MIPYITNSLKTILAMAKNDLKTKYAESYAGLLWAFVQPLFTIGVLLFVFQVGFRSASVSSHPFALWLSIGIIAWFFLADAISAGTNSIRAQSFLVKKVVFNTYLLPLSSILASFFIHVIFIAIILLVCLAYGYTPDPHWIQIFYYLACAVFLCIAISYLTSSIAVFFPDVGQIVGLILQLGFWLTPIFWSITILPPKYQAIIELNPVYYIVDGYRDSLINGVWFWEKGYLGLVFWGGSSLLFGIGIVIFRKLRPYFADVL